LCQHSLVLLRTTWEIDCDSLFSIKNDNEDIVIWVCSNILSVLALTTDPRLLILVEKMKAIWTGSIHIPVNIRPNQHLLFYSIYMWYSC
jgi:hypothetical protein